MRLRILILLFLTGSPCMAQINSFAPINIGVNWDKTTHLIFPTSIKYFSTVSEYIVADNIDNILSIKANEENYTGKSSLTVATGDGQVYSFSISYQSDFAETTHVIGGGPILPERLYINTKNEIHLLFPTEVKYIDYGSEAVTASPTTDLQNIVRISAPQPYEYITNVSVATVDNQFYTFDIEYNDTETNYTYYIGDHIPAMPAILKKEDLTDRIKQDVTEKLNEKGRKIFALGIKKNKITFSIHNIFVMDDKLLFRIQVENNSHIKYDIDYLKFYIIDKKNNKRTASQEVEIYPLFIENFVPLVEGKSNSIFTVCFQAFTIPDKKLFSIEINEKNGGRHINYRLKNSDIIDAEAF